MKKILVTILIITVSLSSIIASGKSEESKQPEKTTITFWTFHSNAEKDFMQNLAKEYEKVNPNVKVKFEAVPQSEYMSAKLTTAFASGSGPDVFLMSPGDFLKYVNSGAAMDLSNYFTDTIREDFLKSSLDAVTVNDKIYGVPFEIELLGLYYDKDILEKEGIAPPKTWNELVSATKKLTTNNRSGLIIPPDKGYYQNFVWYPFLWQSNGNVVDLINKKATFEGDSVNKALNLWRDLINAGATAKLTGGPWEPLIASDIAPMQVVGTWIISALEKEHSDKNIGVVPLPTPNGGKAATDAGGWKFMVNGRSKNKDAAAKFVMWAWAENTKMPLEWCTDVKFAYSPRKSVMKEGQAIYTKGLRKEFTESIYSTAIGEPRYPAEIVNAVGDAIQQVMFTNVAVEDAAKEANEKINSFLSDYSGSL